MKKTEEKWIEKTKKTDFAGIAKRLGVSPMLVRILCNRGLETAEEMEAFLAPGDRPLSDPFLMKGMEQAADILGEKISAGKKIRIIGDYDVDGVSATYILLTGLQRLGAEADHEIPRRLEDGYGINESMVEKASGEGIDTIITCDNGISALGAADRAKELGLTMIVTDHHQPGLTLPDAAAVIDPHQEGCAYPYKDLCGAVVALQLIRAMFMRNGVAEAEEEELTKVAAMATVADIMPLTGENRAIVKKGLKGFREIDIPGLRTLMNLQGLYDREITSYHIGFVIGPCLNAAGRLDTAERALLLLTERDEAKAEAYAVDLKDLNDSRKELTANQSEEAVRIAEETGLDSDKVIVLHLPECHESIAGIVAGRVKEYFCRPSFVLTGTDEVCKGSGRSVDGYDMFREMQACDDLMEKYGGHPMAAGLSIRKENIGEFRRRMNEACKLEEEDLIPKVYFDMQLPFRYITEEFVKEIELLEPFGQKNERPLFALRDIEVRGARILGKQRNVLKLSLIQNGTDRMEGIRFGDPEEFLEYYRKKYGETEVERMMRGLENDVRIRIAYYPSVNEYKGQKSLQAVITRFA